MPTSTSHWNTRELDEQFASSTTVACADCGHPLHKTDARVGSARTGYGSAVYCADEAACDARQAA